MTTSQHLTRLILALALLLQASASAADSPATEDDARLITEASDAINQLSCDPTTVNKISAAARFSPTIGLYADLRAERKPDPRDSLKAAALQACVDASMKHAAGNPLALARTLYNQACHQGSLYDKMSLLTINCAITAVKKVAKNNPDAAEEQLLLYETTRLYLLRNNFEGDNPMRFAELLELEKRVLNYYATHPETLDKAEIYHKFAFMKGYTDYPEDFNLASEQIFLNDTDAAKAAPYEYDMKTGQSTNSPYYYRTSIDIFRRMLGQGSIDYSVPLINTVTARIGQGEDSRLLATADSLVTAVEGYFTEKNPAVIELKSMRDYIASQTGYPLRFAWKYADMLKAYRDHYGDGSPSHTSMIISLAINLSFSSGADALPKEFYDFDREYTAKARRVFNADIGQYVNDQLYFLMAYEMKDTKAFNDKLAELTATLSGDDLPPSWKLYAVMRYITQYNYNNGRNAEALAMDNKATACLDRLTGGKPIPLTAVNTLWTAMHLEQAQARPDSVKQAYERAIALSRETGVQMSDFMFCYAQYLQGLGDYAAATECMKDLLKEDYIATDPVGEAYIKLYLGSMMLNNDDPDSDGIRRLYESAIPVFTADTAVVNAETVNGYLFISHYYNYLKQDDKSMKALEDGWDLMERICNPTHRTWLTFCNELFGFYLAKKGDAYAERFNERQIAKLDSMGLNTSTTYLELLWNRIIIADWRTPNDYLTLFVPYMQQIPAIMAVYERSGQSKQVLYDYGVRILCGVINTITRACDYINIPLESVPEEYRDGIAYGQRMLKQYEDYAIPTMLEIERDFPEYAKPYDYRSNSQYMSLISALYGWYRYVRPDRERAEHYLKLNADVYNYNNQPWEGDDLIATYYVEENDKAKAYEYSSKCYAQLGRFRDFKQIQVAMRQSLLANELGHDGEAMAVSLDYARMIRQYVLGNFDYISSNERANFINAYGLSGAAINAVLGRRPDELAAPAYDAALFDKGLLLHSWERVRRSVMRSGDNALIAQLDTLDRLNKQRNALAVAVGDQDAYNKQAAMQNDIDRLEKRVAAATAKWRTDTMRVASWSEVAARLSEGEAAIEFVMADSALAALVVRPGYDRPHYVRLCLAKECADLLHATDDYPAETRARRLYTHGRSRLYELVWQPMESELQGVSTVYYSPTAFLHRIAFAALPVSADSCLMDKYDLRYVTTTAQLLRPARRRTPATATVFGGISYSPGQAEAATAGGSGNREAIEEEFGYLAETKAEADTITRDMELTGIAAEKYMGERGTEPNFYTLDGNSTDIIHIATHGFYIPDDKAGDNRFLANHPGSKHSPMQRTGLAFAGANATWTGAQRPDREDGILTANELSLLDLGQTDLVVLSACETALGDYSLEGVYGLQRGFKEAGARTLVLSLWNVNDQTTASFMQDFYRHWLGGESKREAFAKAVAALRATHPNPFFWAAYVMLDGE